MKLYSTREAAEYLGLSIPGLKYHLYQARDLTPQKVGKTLVFTCSELDRFRQSRRQPRRK